MTERERIVQWLRKEAGEWGGLDVEDAAHALEAAANAIERGDHMEDSDGKS